MTIQNFGQMIGQYGLDKTKVLVLLPENSDPLLSAAFKKSGYLHVAAQADYQNYSQKVKQQNHLPYKKPKPPLPVCRSHSFLCTRASGSDAESDKSRDCRSQPDHVKLTLPIWLVGLATLPVTMILASGRVGWARLWAEKRRRGESASDSDDPGSVAVMD